MVLFRSCKPTDGFLAHGKITMQKAIITSLKPRMNGSSLKEQPSADLVQNVKALVQVQTQALLHANRDKEGASGQQKQLVNKQEIIMFCEVQLHLQLWPFHNNVLLTVISTRVYCYSSIVYCI